MEARGAPTPKVEVKMNLAIFLQKLHEIERIWRGPECVLGVPFRFARVFVQPAVGHV